jgi:DNA-binding XRE family transcriptional regulator
MSNNLLNQIICVIAGRIIATEAGNVAGELRSKEWRKGWFLNPKCHLVFRTVRVDSNPLVENGEPLSQRLRTHRFAVGLTQRTLAATLGVSLETLKNWEQGRATPNRRSWPAIAALFWGRECHGFAPPRNQCKTIREESYGLIVEKPQSCKGRVLIRNGKGGVN